ncbi:BDH_1b_G0027880.mRNA.1.CDS.1 [Saccharomyces cerevisiae]|nr:BDH_1b_G0027880.mRNA.1.CDS.1 [Saccharomyces cerevisiae]CAI7096883.1 BDH_1b_G0027880.mRNA.1.CDS.1 [Saccharomyces cerevisiae]
MQLFSILSLLSSLMCSLTVLGSSASSYVKFPVQKFADIINIGTQDVSTVFKRNEVLNTTVINGIGVYVVKMEIGTPPQTVYLQLDTGSSDMIVNNADIAYCKSMSDGSDYASTDNYELTATSNGLPSTTISSEAYNTLCSYWGTFDASNSSTFENNATFFNNTYGDGTYYAGTYGTDVVSFENITLNDFTFGVSNDTIGNPSGILGISLPIAEFTDGIEYALALNRTPFIYDNFPMELKNQGKINKIAYSLFLNGPDAHFGSILFGAVDKSKYTGQLYTLPMLQAFNTLGSNPGMIITAQSVAILDSESGNKTVSDIQFPVMLDSGTTFSYLPTEIAEAIGKSFDGEYSFDDQGYIFDCSKVNDTLLSVDFGGFNISANISNFVTSAKDRCVLNVKQSESTYMLGDAFLVDAYVVYDLENYEISIAQASFNNQEEDIEVISDTVPGATPAPGYFSTWVYKPGSPIGTGDFINVSWTSYSEFSQYKSLLATAAQSDDASSFSSSGGSSETTTKKQNAGYKYRSSFSFSLLSFISYFLL